MAWKEEFGPLEGIPPLVEWMVKNEFLIDDSWHNDRDPSFIPTEGEWEVEAPRLFIESEVRSTREAPDQPRFTVKLPDGDLVEFDDLEKALERLMTKRLWKKALKKFEEAYSDSYHGRE